MVLALDVGEARIGLARGVVGSTLAFGRGALTRSTLARDLATLKTLADEEAATLLVVGLPMTTRGGSSLQTERVRSFANELKRAGFSITFVDERYSSALSSRELAGGGLRRGARQEKSRIDEGAAVAICQTFLEQVALRSPQRHNDTPGETA